MSRYLNHSRHMDYTKDMAEHIYRDKRYSIIKENAKMIRRLLLKFY